MTPSIPARLATALTPRCTALYEGRELSEELSEVVDAERLEALLFWGVDAEVDFETEQVLVASRYITETCSIQIDGWAVIDDGDELNLRLEVTDTSGACVEICAMVDLYGVMVVVPRDEDVSICVQTNETCPE